MWGKKSKCSICGHRIYFWSAGSTHKIYTNLGDISSNCNKNVLFVLLQHRGVPGLDGALGDIVGTFWRPPSESAAWALFHRAPLLSLRPIVDNEDMLFRGTGRLEKRISFYK